MTTFTKSDIPQVGQSGANLSRLIRSGTLLYRFQRWQDRELVETSRLKLAAVPYLRHKLVDETRLRPVLAFNQIRSRLPA